jgi:4-hydroxy-tetrahydrodipicolinate synthase
MVSAKEAKDWAPGHLRGQMSALYTPFCGRDGDDIDYDALRKLTRYCLVDLKRNGIYCCGTVAEFWALTKDERKKIAETVIDEVNKINPKAIKLVHTTCLPVKDAAELTQHAQQLGADIAVLLTPFFEAVGVTGIYDYIRYIAERTDMPFALYNHPGTGFILSPEVCADFYNKIPAVCCVKNAAPQPGHTLALHRLAPKMVIWDCNLLEAGMQGYMKLGYAAPVIMGSADYLEEIPGKMLLSEHWELLMEGKLTEATEQYYTSGLADVVASRRIRASSPERPGWDCHWGSGYKYVASLLGLPVGDYPHSRPPGAPFPEELKKRLRDVYVKVGYIKP